MGALSAMSSINRLIDRHGDDIKADYAAQVPPSIRDQLQEIVLENTTYGVQIYYRFADGEMPGPSLEIDDLAEQFPEAAIAY